MNEALQTGDPPDRPVLKCHDLNGACETCGQDAEIEIEGRGWCAACLHAQGSCCGESEKDGSLD